MFPHWRWFFAPHRWHLRQKGTIGKSEHVGHSRKNLFQGNQHSKKVYSAKEFQFQEGIVRLHALGSSLILWS
ncbi:hypothetical protein K1719_002353 [Acacia pycnantha]|nr:hypothetical protein K1719_002353 [Acacia pycnantha]